MKIKYVIFISLCLIFVSCVSPDPIITFKPQAEVTKWNNGREFAVISEKGLKVMIGFYQNTHEFLIFDVIIENTSDKTTLIDPSNFALKAYDNSYRTLAVNPENKIFELNEMQNKLIVADKNSWIGDIIIETVDLAATAAIAASDDNNSDYHIENYSDRVTDRMIDRENREYYHNSNMNNLLSAKYNWQNNTIRKTHLDSGFYIDGQVYFKRTDEIRKIEIVLPLGNTIFTIPFEQTIHYIN